MLDIDSVMFYLTLALFGGSVKIELHQVLAASYPLYTIHSVRMIVAMMISEISL